MRFLEDTDLGSDLHAEVFSNFMPYSFLAVMETSTEYAQTERRFNHATPKSFLELIALYKSILGKRRGEADSSITRLSNRVTKLESTAEQAPAPPPP